MNLISRLFFGKDDRKEDSVGKDGGDAVDEQDQPDGGASLAVLNVVFPWGTANDSRVFLGQSGFHRLLGLSIWGKGG